MEPKSFTYEGAGISIDVMDAAKKQMTQFVQDGSNPLNRLGAFASLVDLRGRGFRDPVLVMKTEEPGSKQLLAFRHNRIEEICTDMVNHLVNDCIVMGATPIAVQDAIICGQFKERIVLRIVEAIAAACKANDCLLVGGETSVQPGVLPQDTVILTSTIIGAVERDCVVDGSKIRPGDNLIAIASSGLHTNGFTLVRKLIEADTDILDVAIGESSFLERVFDVHVAYYPALKPLIAKQSLQGMAHITGGGIADNLRRILPTAVDAQVDLRSIRVPGIFDVIKSRGNVDDREMLRTFNCGVGMILAVRADDTPATIQHIASAGMTAYICGTVVKGAGNVVFGGSLNWC